MIIAISGLEVLIMMDLTIFIGLTPNWTHKKWILNLQLHMGFVGALKTSPCVLLTRGNQLFMPSITIFFMEKLTIVENLLKSKMVMAFLMEWKLTKMVAFGVSDVVDGKYANTILQEN